MSYLVLARKYRPQNFKEVVGQEHVTKTLINSIKRDQIGHAYIFSGLRGVGKTSIARIFSKSLNCAEGPTESPCLECANCKEIGEGNNLAVREIDGASHNSVENVRELIESFRSLPPPGSRFKIYIIDEVHMLTHAAFNALLKSLEEPPPNTVFILATTELHKIPETVRSRCQQHEFRALGSEFIQSCLEGIISEEGLSVQPEVIRMIAKAADGSMRDAQSLLERVRAFCEGEITVDEASQVLGIVDQGALRALATAILGRDVPAALETIERVFSAGISPTLFLRDFASHWRELLIAGTAKERGLEAMGIAKDLREDLLNMTESVSPHDLQDLAYIARDGADNALRSAFPKYSLEALVVRMATREPVQSLVATLQSVKNSDQQTPSSTFSAPSRSTSAEVKKNFKVELEPKASEKIETEEESSEDENLDDDSPKLKIQWEEFVVYVDQDGDAPPLFVEQLKRLSISTFVHKKLEGNGPEFSVRYLNSNDNQEQFQKLLQGYTSNSSQWQVRLEPGASDSANGNNSIAAREKAQKKADFVRQTKNIASHPQVLTLRKHFPGSTVEGVRLKGK